jgi:hypothetical protein
MDLQGFFPNAKKISSEKAGWIPIRKIDFTGTINVREIANIWHQTVPRGDSSNR